MAFKKGKTRSRTEKKPMNKSLTKALVAILVAIIGWTGLTFVESYILSDRNVTSVVIASADISQGTIITKDNADKYFKTENINSDLVTKKTVTDIKDIKGKFLTDMAAGEIVTSDRYYETGDTRELKSPVSLTFAAGSAENSVNGTIRGGDIVDIYVSVSDNNSTTYQLARENVYIENAYDSSYARIDSADHATVASTFLVKLEEDDAANFKNAISQGDLLVVKKDVNQKDTASVIIPAKTEKTAEPATENTESTENVKAKENAASTENTETTENAENTDAAKSAE